MPLATQYKKWLNYREPIDKEVSGENTHTRLEWVGIFPRVELKASFRSHCVPFTFRAECRYSPRCSFVGMLWCVATLTLNQVHRW